MGAQAVVAVAGNGGVVPEDRQRLRLVLHDAECPARAAAANPLALGLTVAGTGELLAGARLGHAARRATTAAALLLAVSRSSWRLPALSAALAGASLDLGSNRGLRAGALVRMGVLLTLLREVQRIESWERT